MEPSRSFQTVPEPIPFPVSEAGKAVSEAEYWEDYYSHDRFSYEWNNGILEEIPMPEKDSLKLYEWMAGLLREYLQAHPIGELIFLETAFQVKGKPSHSNKKQSSHHSIRKPDLGLILNNNPTPWKQGEMSYKGQCDLCIEALSYSSLKEINRDTLVKKREYELAGVKEYFILDQRHHDTAFYGVNVSGKYEPIPLKEGDIVCSQVLPEFAFRLSDMKALRPYKQLVDDPIYQPYLLKDYQNERQLKERERQLKEAALEREAQLLLKVEQAERKALEMAKAMKQKGLDLSTIGRPS